jgi:hypothetical protein
MTDTQVEWTRALTAVKRVLREPGALSERSLVLLRVSVQPQIESAIAMLSDGLEPHVLRRWNAFLPAAVAAVGPDPGLARVEEHLRAGLAAL